MPSFSQFSLNNLETCDSRLQDLMHECIKHFDFRVLEGRRGEEAQNRLFEEGKTKLKWPDSKHNKSPSIAVDIVPYPVDWNDRDRFVYMAGIVMGIACQMGLKIRWGGDWDQNQRFNESFFDAAHFEIMAEEE